MTGQDLALLGLTQLALIIAGALTAWTCWHAGYQSGWDTRARRDPFHGMANAMRTAAKRFQQTMASWQPRLSIPDTDHRTDAMHYALMTRAAMTVTKPDAGKVLRNITS